MSAPLTSLHRCCQRSALLLLVARRQWCSSSASPPPPPLPRHRRLLLFLTQRYYDIEMLVNWKSQLKRKWLEWKNIGPRSSWRSEVTSQYYVLRLRGGFRYAGQSEWFRADHRGRFRQDFLKHKGTPLEEVDMSHTDINFTGLRNLASQQSLRTLKLRGCPYVDDWFLSRLHVFEDCLEELDISHCPQITTGGLAALRNLKGLKRLDVSSLPRIEIAGLVVILLEEMLPQCQITATGYNLDLSQAGGEKEVEELSQRQR
ncbi:ATP synthase subunit s-like protein [Stegastes partitus]|nr:PREDICTED: ATP synthase subunit s-like protein [Stegastes partitus]